MAQDLRAILRDNVRALLGKRAGGDIKKAGVSGLIGLGVPNGTAQRVLGGETSVGVNVVAQLAEIFGVDPWMLLVPGLNADAPPGLTDGTPAWPFELVDQDAYQDLTASERAFIQGAMARDIADLAAKRATRRFGNGR